VDLVCCGNSIFFLSSPIILFSLRLAATLGSKSSFKKIPKRSVLTADISQLCGLIAEPEEPLALRLSSNLMVGVARFAIFLEIPTTSNAVMQSLQRSVPIHGSLQYNVIPYLTPQSNMKYSSPMSQLVSILLRKQSQK
jgi:hypothetical protein